MTTARTLDLSKLQSPERLELAKQTLEGFARDGFIKIVGHGMTENELTQILAWNEAFYNLPPEQKLAISNVPGPDCQRGYQAVGVEKTATLNLNGAVNLDMVSFEDKEDVKETFDMAGAMDTEAPNLWPPESAIPGFRSAMEQYWAKSLGIALQVLTALEVGMDLPPGSLAGRCNGCESEIRMNHYPAAPIEQLRKENVMRIWPHTDAGVITLLVQDANGGLEIEDQTAPGTFNPLPMTDRAELIVNGGEALERWTNGILRPGLHQVNVPSHFMDSGSSTIPSRHSVAFFVYAKRETSMAPLKKFLSDGEVSKFPDMTSREYHKLRNGVVY